MRKRRLQHLVFALVFVQGILAARMFQLQVVQHEEWAERARRSRLEKRTIPATRGRILDRDGVVLAEDRRAYDLMLEYRSFRRGQAVGQLFELCQLIGLPATGLVEVEAQAEALTGELLSMDRSRLAGLGSRRRGDALYYLRRLCGFSRSQADSIEAWALESEQSFGEAFPKAAAGMAQSIADSRQHLRELEYLLGSRLGDPLLERLERERQRLERQIRQQAVRTAAGVALGIGAWEVRDMLALDAEPRQAAAKRAWRVEREFALQDLKRRWQWPGETEELGALIAPPTDPDSLPSMQELGELLALVETVSTDDVAGLRRDLVAQVHRDRVARLVRGVDFEVVDRIGQDPDAFAGLQVRHAAERLYPEDFVPQLIGRVNIADQRALETYLDQRSRLQELGQKLVRTESEESDYQALRRQFLRSTMRPGDVRGADGLEAAFEEVLRGERGYLRELAGAEEEGEPRELEFMPPRAGHDVQISVSTVLTRAAERAIEQAYAIARDHARAEKPSALRNLDIPKVGFALLDLRDGSVPVLATAPSYEREQLRTEYRELAEDTERGVFRHRALGGNATGPQVPYPGSTYKPLIALLALEEDPAAWDREIYCSGHWLPPGMTAGPQRRPLECKNHYADSLNMHDALKLSCNTYFYTLGNELGWERIWDRSRALGFGAPTGVEVVEIEPYSVEDRESSADDGVRFRPVGPNARLETGANFLGSRHREFNSFTLARFGIGQVSVHASPLQMARFYGWLATGELVTPRLVLRSAGGAPAIPAPQTVDVPASDLQRVRQALRAVTEHVRGTAYDEKYRLDVFQVAGKTGTAQPSKVAPTHAWFAGYFPWDEPRYAFAILCENVDLHGGEIANLVLHQFLSTEEVRQYLSDPQH